MVLPLVIGLFGSAIGSFLNVVIYRVPKGRSVVSPPSACGSCGHVVRPIDNIPLLSWLILRGRCRDCRAPISVRYPLVELGAAVAFAVVAWRFLPDLASSAAGGVAAGIQLVAFLYLAAISLALALIDLDTRRLPDVLVLPAYAVGTVLFTAGAAVSGRWADLAMSGLGIVALGGTYLALALIRPGGMGMGDVKLAGALGLFLGWLGLPALLVGAVGGFVLGGVVGVGLLLGGHGRGARIAFGPWLLGGAWLGILAGQPIAEAYLALFGITT